MKKLITVLLFISLVCLANCGPFSININISPVSDLTKLAIEGTHVDMSLKLLEIGLKKINICQKLLCIQI